MGTSKNPLSLPIADSPRVNVGESGRERSGIIRRQFCGARQVAAIFRGAHMWNGPPGKAFFKRVITRERAVICSAFKRGLAAGLDEVRDARANHICGL